MSFAFFNRLLLQKFNETHIDFMFSFMFLIIPLNPYTQYKNQNITRKKLLEKISTQRILGDVSCLADFDVEQAAHDAHCDGRLLEVCRTGDCVNNGEWR